MSTFAVLVLFALIYQGTYAQNHGFNDEANTLPFRFENQTLTKAGLTTRLHVNLKNATSFTLYHDLPVQICFQETYVVPTLPSEWATSCTFYFLATTTTSTYEGILPLRDVTYNVGISFTGSVPDGLSDEVSLVIGNAGDDCPEGTVFDSRACVVPTPLSRFGPNSLNLTKNRPVVVSFEAPDLTGSISVKRLVGEGNFTLRRKATPTRSFYDGIRGAAVFYEYPRPGIYYLLIQSKITQNVHFSVELEDCTQSHASGRGCKTVYLHDDATNDGLAIANSYTYWSVEVKSDEPLRVSLRENYAADKDKRPRLFASRGNLPVAGNADLTGCNSAQCEVADVLELNLESKEEKQTWFIGVTSQPGQNGTSFGIWFEDVCPPACEDNYGQCDNAGNRAGLCVCQKPEDSGVACQIQQSIDEQYVVLASIWGTAAVVTILVLVFHFFTPNKATYERIA